MKRMTLVLSILLAITGFRSTALAQTFGVIHGFDSVGGTPLAGVIEGSDKFLYGTTYYGGAGDHGTVFRMKSDGTGFLILHAFNFDDASNGDYPRSPVIEGCDGVLYGTTYFGGSYGNGIVFKVDRDGTRFQKLHDFNYLDLANGSNPSAGLLEGSDGALYGTTYLGGVHDMGVVFKINKDGTGFQKLHDFGGIPDGSYPYAGLIEVNDGALYGTTYEGGTYDFGVVFKINKNGTGFTTLHHFHGVEGARPYAGVVEGSDGALYGTTYYGGRNGDGAVFKVNRDGTGFSRLHDFEGEDGSQPTGGFIEGFDGTLYGTTQYGGVAAAGVVFKINKDGTGFATVHDFNGTDGDQATGLVEGSEGSLYGTTAYGGAYGAGEVFTFNGEAGFRELYAFGYTDGAKPYAEVIEGSDGLLYGTTSTGGKYDAGTVFKIDKDGTGFLSLHDFNGAADGADGVAPHASLVEASDGMLYGTTLRGGSDDFGVIFTMNKNGSGFRKLHDFLDDGSDGLLPSAPLLEASDGVLYGTTLWGGVYDALNGTIFKINRDGSGFEKLHDFNDDEDEDGIQPSVGLIEGSDGALYGGTNQGGAYFEGVVFKINKDGSGFKTLHHFNEADGANVYGPLLQGSDDALYGTTQFGGESNFGTVFKINPDGSGFETLHYFNRSDGENPEAGLMEGPDGKLYGTTESGGKHDSGLIFKVEKDGTGFQRVHDFNHARLSDGDNPSAALVQGSDGNAYGTTSDGGPGGGGVVYRLAFGCEASLQVQDGAHAPGSAVAVRVHIAHRRPKTVTVPWELSLIDSLGQVILRHTTAPHTFEPGDVIDRELDFRLPNDIPAGAYTLRIAISEMAGTNGATTTLRVVPAE